MTISLSLTQGSCQKQLTYVADKILDSKRLLFVSGAGISCSAGIPDFRSLNGLYSTTPGAQGKIKGKELFDVSLFSAPESTSLFYQFMADLRLKTLAAQPTPTHRFLNTLKERKTLLRSYTQNIDGLEARAGLCLNPMPFSQNDAIQLHGDIHTLKCFLCSETFAYNDRLMATLQSGAAPECPTCADKCAMRLALGRRAIAIGSLRPDIVLYGENHPAGDQIAQACASDLKKKPDCLLIAGTSLKIPGLKRLVKDFAKSVHDRGGLVVLVDLSETLATEWHSIIDYHVQGASDDFISLLKTTRPAFFTLQSTLKTLRQTKQTVKNTSDQCSKRKVIKLKIQSPRKPSTKGLQEALVVPNARLKLEYLDKIGFEAKVSSSSDEKENTTPGKRAFSEAFTVFEQSRSTKNNFKRQTRLLTA